MSAYARPFPIDATMTVIAIACQNLSMEMLHKKVLPPVPVLTEDFKWLNYPVDQYFNNAVEEVGRLGRVPQVTFGATEERAFVRDYGLDDAIPLTDVEAADAARRANTGTHNPQNVAVEGLTALIELSREVRAAAVVEDVNNYDVSRRIAIAGGDKFSAYTTSDPFEVLNEGMTKPLVHRANTIVMGQVVWEVLKRHPKTLKACKGGLQEDGAVSRAQFADLMEVDLTRLLVGVSMLNAAKPGQPLNLAKVWGNSIELLFVDMAKQSTTDSVLTWGFTTELGHRIAGQIPDPDIGLKGGFRIRVGERVTEVVCAKSLGYIIKDPI